METLSRKFLNYELESKEQTSEQELRLNWEESKLPNQSQSGSIVDETLPNTTKASGQSWATADYEKALSRLQQVNLKKSKSGDTTTLKRETKRLNSIGANPQSLILLSKLPTLLPILRPNEGITEQELVYRFGNDKPAIMEAIRIMREYGLTYDVVMKGYFNK